MGADGSRQPRRAGRRLPPAASCCPIGPQRQPPRRDAGGARRPCDVQHHVAVGVAEVGIGTAVEDLADSAPDVAPWPQAGTAAPHARRAPSRLTFRSFLTALPFTNTSY